jgi:AraC-like DNA-binding protein
MATLDSLVRVGALGGYRELCDEWGVDHRALLCAAGIEPSQLDSVDNLIPGSAFIRALSLGAKASRRDDFGLNLGHRQGIDILGPVGFLARQCETLGEAITAVGRFVRLRNTAAIVTVKTDGRSARMVYQDVTPGVPQHPQTCDRALAIGSTLVRIFAGEDWMPTAALFCHQPPNQLACYRQFLGSELRFDQPCYALEFDASLLGARQSTSDPQLRAFFYKHMLALESRFKDDFSALVVNLVRSLIESGHCSQERVAEIMQISCRTLQRRLRADGLTFRGLLASVRGDLAEQYLTQTEVPITDLSAALGFSELSAFTRFFTRRAGVSPSQFRTVSLQGHDLSR